MARQKAKRTVLPPPLPSMKGRYMVLGTIKRVIRHIIRVHAIGLAAMVLCVGCGEGEPSEVPENDTGKQEVQEELLNPGMEQLYPVRGPDGKWGYIDATGTIQIPPQYRYASVFSCGRAIVKVAGRCGAIDLHGRLVIPAIYAYLGTFLENRSFARRDDGAYVLLDRGGRAVSEEVYIRYVVFRNGVAVTDKQTGARMQSIIVDTSGNEYWLEYTRGLWFSEGLLMVEAQGRTILLDRRGNELLGPFPSTASLWVEAGVFLFLDRTGKCGLMDITGGVVVRPFADSMWPPTEGLARFKLAGKWGYVAMSGEVAIPPVFDDVMPFQQGFAFARRGDVGGFIDKSGQFVMVIPHAEQSRGFGERRELAFVVRHDGEKDVYVDRQGMVVWPPEERKDVSTVPSELVSSK